MVKNITVYSGNTCLTGDNDLQLNILVDVIRKNHYKMLWEPKEGQDAKLENLGRIL